MATAGDIKLHLGVDSADFKRGLDQAQDQTKKFASGLDDVTKKNLQEFGLGLAAIATAAVAFGVSAVKAFTESEVVDSELNRVLEATGKAATISGDGIRKMAKEMIKHTGYSDEAIKSGISTLLRFDGINKDTLPRATQMMVDLARTMKTDVSSAAEILGKSLTDPELAFRLLKDAGVILTDQQKEDIQTMKDVGDAAGYQGRLFELLGPKIKDSAQIYSETWEGKWAVMKAELDEVNESLGKIILDALLPFISKLDEFVKSDGFTKFEDWTKNNPKDVQQIVTIILILIGVIAVGLAGAFIVAHAAVFAFGAVLALVAATILGPIRAGWNALKDLLAAAKIWWNDNKETIRNWILTLVEGWARVTTSVSNAMNDIKSVIGNMILSATNAWRGLLNLFGVRISIPAPTILGASSSGVSGGLLGGMRASGGPVSSGLGYLVGENGPEMFYPNTDGTIVPNGKTGGVNITVNMAGVLARSRSDVRAVASDFIESVNEGLRAKGLGQIPNITNSTV